MKKKLNKLALLELIILILCYGDFVITGLRLMYGILSGSSISLTYFGIAIAFIELLVSEVCFNELQKRYTDKFSL